MNNETFNDYIYCATLEDATNYLNDPEKFTFCLLYLDISANDPDADRRVNDLENHFETLLENAAIDLQEVH